MSGMFANSKFNKKIGKWNTSKVETMSEMFADYEFNRDLSAWDVSNVKNFTGMFQDYRYGISYLYDKWRIRRDADLTNFEFDHPSEEYKRKFNYKI